MQIDDGETRTHYIFIYLLTTKPVGKKWDQGNWTDLFL